MNKNKKKKRLEMIYRIMKEPESPHITVSNALSDETGTAELPNSKKFKICVHKADRTAKAIAL